MVGQRSAQIFGWQQTRLETVIALQCSTAYQREQMRYLSKTDKFLLGMNAKTRRLENARRETVFSAPLRIRYGGTGKTR